MMSSGAIQEYVGAIQRRYDAASSRREKSEILDEICRTSGVHRKHALRLLRKARQPVARSGSRQKRGAKKRYHSPELKRALRTVWKHGNFPCSKRLAAMLPEWLPNYEACFEPLSDELRSLLLSIAPATI